MRVTQMFQRALHRGPKVDESRPARGRSGRGVALVIADAQLAATVSELYQARGYEVFVPETPRDVIDTLSVVGDQVRAVVISSDVAWASGWQELIGDELPDIERITLVS